jgi:glycosyltransferase involved in cell wall biosynthesis
LENLVKGASNTFCQTLSEMKKVRKIKVSIIIPTFNCSSYLKEAIESVRAQTYTDWEIIIVNNYSEDDTVEVVEEFEEDRITLVNYQNHGVIAAARNEGVRYSKGEYIAFLDSDDRWLPNKLSMSLNKLKNEADFVSHGVLHFGDVINWKNKSQSIKNIKCEYKRLLFGRNWIITSTVVMRRESFDKVGGFTTNSKIITAEDWDLWLRLLNDGCKMHYLAEYLGEYRIHENNASIGNIEKHVAAKLYVLNKHISQQEYLSLWDHFKIRGQKSDFFYGQGRVLQLSSKPKYYFQYFCKSFLLNPLNFRLFYVLLIFFQNLVPNFNTNSDTISK